MKGIVIFAVTAMMLFAANLTQGGVSLIRNPSFEQDGELPDITLLPPAHWCDVNIPVSKFGGYVNTLWATHGDLPAPMSLALVSKFNSTFDAGDKAIVCQPVLIEQGVTRLTFDLKLSSSGGPWDPVKRSAIVLVDGQEIWNSGGYTPDANGELLAQEVDVTAFADGNDHVVALGICSNVTEQFKPWIEYRAQWDFVRLDSYCGGFGFLLLEDVTGDCAVDFADFAALAAWWMGKPPVEYDLFPDDIIDLTDIRFIADAWLDTAESLGDLLDVPETDINADGLVDFADFQMLAAGWDQSGLCLDGDIDRSLAVDYFDLAALASDWLTTNWISGF